MSALNTGPVNGSRPAAPSRDHETGAGVEPSSRTAHPWPLAPVWRTLRHAQDVSWARRFALEAVTSPPAGDLTSATGPGRIQRATVTESGVVHVYLGPAQGSPSSILKIARATENIASLQRHAVAVATLTADDRLGAWRQYLPVIAWQDQRDGRFVVAERVVPGVVASRELLLPGQIAALLPESIAAISELHRVTGRTASVTAGQLSRWVSRPAQRLVDTGLLRSKAHRGAVDRVVDELGTWLGGREVATARIHGDYWPGNILVRPGLGLSGILDWDQSEEDELVGHDLIHLLLYTRRIRSGQDVGVLVAKMVEDPRWTREERDLLAIAGPGLASDPAATRALILMYWLRYVDRLLQSPHHATSQRWVRRNILSVAESTRSEWAHRPASPEPAVPAATTRARLPVRFGPWATGRFVRDATVSSVGRVLTGATPLLAGAYALIASSAITSALGLLYWLLAARLYPTAEVGVASATISAMVLVSGIAQLGLYGGLGRFIPTAGRSLRRLVSSAYLASGLVAMLTCAVAWMADFRWGELDIFTDSASGLWFLIATVTWTIFVLQDAVLSGLRKALWLPLENGAFGIAKLALLVVLAATNSRWGILGSWVVSAVLTVIPISLLIFGRFIPRHAPPALRPEPLTLKIVARFVAGDYIGFLLLQSTIALLPLLVISQLGPTASAYFYVAWLISYSLGLVASGLATSLLIEGARDPERLLHTRGVAVRHLFIVLIPGIVALWFAGPIVVALISPQYGEKVTDLLRVLAISAIPGGLAAVWMAVARVRRQTAWIALAQLVNLSVVAALTFLLIPTQGITGVGLAWLVGQTVTAVMMVAPDLWPIRRRGPTLSASVRASVRQAPAAGSGTGTTVV